ncbi:MAG: tRNA (N(6)-L-threonylcarbamoyladenosine(37)-C(2))-methylthiotransferase MtaB [Bacillota bacterium]|nr:tRNA (N(6)-L-threonylcarbamoyladenosine(37)-C(2))-methylthiotransferase MtaB [Bacillota bacterium]
MNPKKVAFYTLGCKVNQQDSESLASMFEEGGYETVDFKEAADVYIINTCTVTHLGDRKSRQMIRRAIKENPEAKVVVTGCYAQTSPGEVLAIAGVDLVVGTKDRKEIVSLVEKLKKSNQPVNLVDNIMASKEFEELPLPSSSRARAFIKVQEGCNQFCTYCIVPYARGPIRSRPLEGVINQVKELVDQGYQEVVLTGTHTGMYGKDQKIQQVSLAQLVKALTTTPGLERLRISSVDPNDFTEELIEVLISSPVICPHFHIPLQSGDDEILKRMKRPYNVASYLNLVEKLRQKSPEVAFTTDVMVGFPGETEEQFQNTVKLIEKVSFSDLHVFKYSPRKGTPAASYEGQIDPLIKEERSQYLLELAKKLQEQYGSRFVNEVRKVLVEKIWQPDTGKIDGGEELINVNAGPTLWEGLTDNYLRVVFPAEGKLARELVLVKLIDWQSEGYMSGRQIVQDA